LGTPSASCERRRPRLPLLNFRFGSGTMNATLL
jgi:hypothetical protein